MSSCAKQQSLTARFKIPVLLEKPTLVADGGGGAIESWVFVAKVWAQIETLSAKEVEHDGHLVMKRVHHIYMRPQKEINATMRFSYQQRHFYITGYYLTSANKKHDSLGQAQQILCCVCEEFEGF